MSKKDRGGGGGGSDEEGGGGDVDGDGARGVSSKKIKSRAMISSSSDDSD